MVYKRYLYRNGKKYGPFYYKSIRDSAGRVRSVYVGRAPPTELEKTPIVPSKSEIIIKAPVPEIKDIYRNVEDINKKLDRMNYHIETMKEKPRIGKNVIIATVAVLIGIAFIISLKTNIFGLTGMATQNITTATEQAATALNASKETITITLSKNALWFFLLVLAGGIMTYLLGTGKIARKIELMRQKAALKRAEKRLLEYKKITRYAWERKPEEVGEIDSINKKISQLNEFIKKMK